MAGVIEPFFEQLATYQYVPRFSELVGSCCLEIERVGNWTLTVTKGKLTVTKNSGAAGADCVITGSEQDFVRMIQRQQNPMTAFLQGRLRVTGDSSLAQIGLRVFRMQPENMPPQREGGQNQ